MEGKAIFMQAGGQEFHYIPCLNERDDWIQALADITLANLQGWLGPEQPDEKMEQPLNHRRVRFNGSQGITEETQFKFYWPDYQTGCA